MEPILIYNVMDSRGVIWFSSTEIIEAKMWLFNFKLSCNRADIGFRVEEEEML